MWKCLEWTRKKRKTLKNNFTTITDINESKGRISFDIKLDDFVKLETFWNRLL